VLELCVWPNLSFSNCGSVAYWHPFMTKTRHKSLLLRVSIQCMLECSDEIFNFCLCPCLHITSFSFIRKHAHVRLRKHTHSQTHTHTHCRPCLYPNQQWCLCCKPRCRLPQAGHPRITQMTRRPKSTKSPLQRREQTQEQLWQLGL